MKSTIRADKLLSSLGITSRRGVERYLKFNNVMADRVKITEHGQRVFTKAEIKINGQPIKKTKYVYYILNKPKGIVSTAKDEFGRKNVVSLIKSDTRIYPVGRLDRDTHGLLILTNDGELTNLLIHPRYHISKTYILTIKGQVMPQHLEKFEQGIELEDGITKPAKARVVQKRKDVTIVELILFEGKKRQIRRMCKALKLNIIDLERIRFGNLMLDGLMPGEYRMLSGKEVEGLRMLLKQTQKPDIHLKKDSSRV